MVSAVLLVLPEQLEVFFYKVVDVSVHDTLDIANLGLGPVVLDHGIRLENIAPDLAAPGHLLLLLGVLLLFFFLLGLVVFVQPRAEDFHGHSPVLYLASLVLALHYNACLEVGYADGGIGLVYMLATGTRGTVCVYSYVLGFDINLYAVVDYWRYIYRYERGVPAGIGVKGRYAHQTVYSRLALQVAVSIVALHLDCYRLYAALGLQQVGYLNLELVPFCPAGVHAVKHAGPVAGLGSAGSGVYGYECVAAVGLFAEQRQGTQPAVLILHFFYGAFYIGLERFIILCHSQVVQIYSILQQPLKLFPWVYEVLLPLDLAHNLLGLFSVVPEAFGSCAVLQVCYLFFDPFGVKDAPRFLIFRL